MSEKPVYQPADRIASFKPYFFAELGKKIASVKAKGMDVIRLDMGSPDLPPAEFIIDALIESAVRPDTHRYTAFGGTPGYRKAIADYYQRRFGVTLDPDKETLGLIGSKEGLFTLSQVLLNPGDISLIPDPGYTVYSAGGIIAGANLFHLPLLEENGFLPELEAIPVEILQRAKVIWLNYPNNPTGAVAPFSFFEGVVDFARKNHLLIAHDAPYADVCFDGYVAPSILQVEGARDVAVEFNSLSKAYNMGGWRLGMVVGNPDVIRYMNTYKTQVDTSHFQPILEAGVTALTSDQSWIAGRNAIYQERRDIALRGLRSAGFAAHTPAAAIYIWAHLPNGYHDSAAFCNTMLEEIGVSTTPGSVYGDYGEGYLRVSLGIATPRLQEAVNRIAEWVKVTP